MRQHLPLDKIVSILKQTARGHMIALRLIPRFLLPVGLGLVELFVPIINSPSHLKVRFTFVSMRNSWLRCSDINCNTCQCTNTSPHSTTNYIFVIRIASITGFAAITSDELYQLD